MHMSVLLRLESRQQQRVNVSSSTDCRHVRSQDLLRGCLARIRTYTSSLYLAWSSSRTNYLEQKSERGRRFPGLFDIVRQRPSGLFCCSAQLNEEGERRSRKRRQKRGKKSNLFPAGDWQRQKEAGEAGLAGDCAVISLSHKFPHRKTAISRADWLKTDASFRDLASDERLVLGTPVFAPIERITRRAGV